MEKANYFDKQGNYINVENLSLAEIYKKGFIDGSLHERESCDKAAWAKDGKWFFCVGCWNASTEKFPFCPNCGAKMNLTVINVEDLVSKKDGGL